MKPYPTDSIIFQNVELSRLKDANSNDERYANSQTVQAFYYNVIKKLQVVEAQDRLRKRIAMQFYKYAITTNPDWEKGEEHKLAPPIYPKMFEKSHLNLKNKRMANMGFTDIQMSVICGTCLSDAGLEKPKDYANFRIQNKHSTRQANWFIWKWAVCLRSLIKAPNTTFQFIWPEGYQKRTVPEETELLGRLFLCSKADLRLTELRLALCSNSNKNVTKNKKFNCRRVIKRCWLNHMNNYFLMSIWLDDGSLDSNNSQGVICWNSTPKEDQIVFSEYLRSVWEVETRVSESKQGSFLNPVPNSPTAEMEIKATQHVILFKDQYNLIKFLKIIAPAVPVKEMLYKVMFIPKSNKSLLQCWASELTELVQPQFRESVRQVYYEIIDNYATAAETNANEPRYYMSLFKHHGLCAGPSYWEGFHKVNVSVSDLSEKRGTR